MQILSKTEFIPPQKGSSKKQASHAQGPDKSREKLRKEFPFLGSPDCPMELKALVTDRISSYHRYQDTWPKLFTASTPEECAVVASTIVNAYIDNRRTWEELNYYQQHHRVLGHHPIFRQFNNIWRVKSEMKKGSKPDLEQARRDRLAGYEAELAEIRRLLDEE